MAVANLVASTESFFVDGESGSLRLESQIGKLLQILGLFLVQEAFDCITEQNEFGLHGQSIRPFVETPFRRSDFLVACSRTRPSPLKIPSMTW